MASLAVEALASAGLANELVYTPSKWNLSSLIKQRKDLGTAFISPSIVGLARPMETSGTIPGNFPSVITWADKKGTNTTGTVTAASTTTINGSGTNWLTAGVPVGAKIGFGTTDRDAVTTWYSITSIVTDNLLIIATPVTVTGSTFVIDMNMQIDWVFFADSTAAVTTTKKLQMYEYNRMTSIFAWKGYLTATLCAGATFVTIKDMHMTYDTFTVGTVAVSGANVTGTNTFWQTYRMCQAQTTVSGSRIGFGSTDPTQISQWYYIDTITGEGTMTIRSNASGANVPASASYVGGTPYVIEDLRGIFAVINATAANGGLFVLKGLNRDHYNSSGVVTTLATATSGYADATTNAYWLGDAAVTTNTVSVGMAIEPKTSWTSQMAYVFDTTGGIKIYKYNIRSALAITSGGPPCKDTSAYVLQTGSQAVVGAVSTTYNGQYAIANHGPMSGTPGLYVITATRIYGIPTASVTSGSTTFLVNAMTEVPPGSVNTFTATGALANIEYAPSLDRFIVISTAAGGSRSYVTQFNTIGTQMDHIFLCEDKQIDQGSADGTTTPHVSLLSSTHNPFYLNGILYLASQGVTAPTNLVHAIPLGADWLYAATTGQIAISPELITPNCSKFQRVYAVHSEIVGGQNLGKSTDAFQLFYRTSGISDNSGSWSVVPAANDLSGVAPSSSIQLAIKYKCISDFGVSARTNLVGVVYNDFSTDSHYHPSATLSNATTKKFAWRFASTFGSNVPILRIRLYDDITGSLLLDDISLTPTSGTWSKSTDGVSWNVYDTSDKTNDTTYIGYTPTSLGDNIRVRSLLTLN